jgi:hypothetical protein
MEDADFSGYATKANLECSDGRTIMPEAFQHMDGAQVPLVWQHDHSSPSNVLGHAILEARPDGMYAYGFFNDSVEGRKTKLLVEHKDVNSLSIFANQLVERSKKVFHGVIRELSVVLAGANPGAMIDNIAIAHGDSITTLDDEAVIYTGLSIELAHSATEEVEETEETEEETEETEEVLEHADGKPKTLSDVIASFTDEQRAALEYLLGSVVADNPVQHSATEDDPSDADNPDSESDSDDENQSEDDPSDDALTHADKEGTSEMTHNLFEDKDGAKSDANTLSHSELKTIVDDAPKFGSLKESFLAHAGEYGITDIDLLFPDAQAVSNTPELIARRTEWVAPVLDGAKHSPFARIKSLAADLTADEARAKGYVKGNLKKDEVVKLLKRVTTPTTVYKKQKLDRDDIVDITGLDVIAWLKWEMRFMLEEELARAILIGDGREPDDDDKINEDNIRPIAWDDDMYSHKITVPTNTDAEGIVETILRSRKHYKGSGSPTLFTTDDILTDMLLIKDSLRRRVYSTMDELAAAMRVKNIVVVEVMEGEADLLAVIVNMSDYTIGADKGGQLAMFDDFDIDYNQQKYLIETRISGCLTKPKSALVIQRVSGTTVTPTVPAFNAATNTITIPTVTGVEYYDVTDPTGTGTLLTAGNKVITKTTDVEARPTAGYNFPHNIDADWTYAYTAA